MVSFSASGQANTCPLAEKATISERSFSPEMCQTHKTCTQKPHGDMLVV
jgi:hypothetical protein